MKTILRALPILALTLVMLQAKPASAQLGGCGTMSGLAPVYGYGFSGNLYGLGKIPVPPYFALHPPVYYSEQVARPYGLSPFAHRSVPVESHAKAKAKPVMIRNPHVTTPATAPDETAPKTARPADKVASSRMIVNPFFAAATDVAER